MQPHKWQEKKASPAYHGRRRPKNRKKLRGGDVIAENIYINEIKRKKDEENAESSDSSQEDSRLRASAERREIEESSEADRNTVL